MMQSAIDAHAMVQPVAIFYPYSNGEKPETEVNPVVLFLGNMPIAESADLIFRTRRIDVEVHYLEPIHSKGATRGEISQHAYDEVVDAVKKIKKQQP